MDNSCKTHKESISQHAFLATFAEYRCLEIRNLASTERDFFIMQNYVAR